MITCTVNCLSYQVRSEGLWLSEGVLGPPLSTPTCALQLSVKAHLEHPRKSAFEETLPLREIKRVMIVRQWQWCGGRLGVSHICALSMFATQYELSELFCLLGEQKLCKLPESLDLTVVAL